MIFVENGKPAGIVVDLAEAMAKRMKRPVKFEYMNWTTAQQLVLDGQSGCTASDQSNRRTQKII